ncbi:MAG: Fic family protein [Coriobacteriales bacterium]|jgi:Fic family protein|nr:Fic family protein [Coriobacteriales bacterium]
MTTQDLINALLEQRRLQINGNVYWQTQIDLAYNSNRIEGSQLTHEQTRYIFETQTISGENVPVDDVVEMKNHFRMFYYMLDHFKEPVSVETIQSYQAILKAGTFMSEDPKMNVGGWKLIPNAVGNTTTSLPGQVDNDVRALLAAYNRHVESGHEVTLTQIAAFHAQFEAIHPFLDGNGRTGRIIMFHQCLQAGLIPPIVMDKTKAAYYAGLDRWQNHNDSKPLLDYLEECQADYRSECEFLLEGKGKDLSGRKPADVGYEDIFKADE